MRADFGGVTPLFDSLLIEDTELRHSGADDALNTLSLTIGVGGKYVFDAYYGRLFAGQAIISAPSGVALFEHTGSRAAALFGTSTSPSNLILGQADGAAGTCRLNGESSLLVYGSTIVGQGGTGTFDNVQGEHSTTSLVLGEQSTGLGTYALNDTGGLRVSGNTVVGQGGSGTFTNAGGRHDGASLVVGAESMGSGTYILACSTERNGVLDITGSTVVGQSGSGTFTNYGAWHNTASLVLGEQLGGSGTYTLTDGLSSPSLSVTGNIVVGQAGSGTLNVEGGGLTATAMIVNATGTLNYSEGEILLDNGTGTLTVAAGGRVNVSEGQPPVFSDKDVYGKVDNAGLFKVTGTTIRYAGEFNNTGIYISDPSTNIFDADLAVTGKGYLVGGLGDVFRIGGSFRNSSSNAAQWDTDLASLIFFGAGTHEFGVAGDSPEAFEWGDIRAGDDVFLSFFESSAIAGMVLRVGVLDLAEQLAGIIVPAGQFLTIYFDQARQENAYLLAALNSGQLPAGLTLIAYGAPPNNAPEPSTLVLMAAGLGLLLRRDRWRGGRVQVV